MKPLKVLFLTAEAAPLIKVGGLGDVAGSLPQALRSLPERPDVRVCLPLYPTIQESSLELSPIASLEVSHQEGPLRADVYQSTLRGVPFYFIDGLPVTTSRQVYSGDNQLDGVKFVFFSLAALELARILDWKPDILHAQDWHTAPAVYKLDRIRTSDSFFKQTGAVLTVHNLPYLGHGAEKALIDFGLPPARSSSLPTWAQGLPLPQGLAAADKISTVSPGYAQEMLTPEFGAGIEGFLRTRAEDLIGIVNGLDEEEWDPEIDSCLIQNYTAAALKQRIQNKTSLQAELELEQDPSIPLLAMINRMEYQKGVDLVPDALRALIGQEFQMIILGTGDPSLEYAARQLSDDYPQITSLLKYDGALARRIYSGSDMILIPSRYEPCGLTQMIGMRYGCLPLARSTGGLKDTIIPYDQKGSTGFLFDQATPQALKNAIQEALEVYKDQRIWQGLQRRGMKADFSWERSAIKYLDLYNEISTLSSKIEN